MDIYDVLNEIISNKKYSLNSALYTDEYRNKLGDEEKEVFDLLKNVSSIYTEINNDEIRFIPMYELSNGYRTFSGEDLTENDFSNLKNLKLEKIPLILRAVIANLIWSYQRDYKAAQTAANAYWELFKLWFANDDDFRALDMIRRAVLISKKIKFMDLYNDIYKWFCDFLNDERVYKNVIFSLRVMELFEKQKDFNASLLIPVLDEIIRRNCNNISQIEQAYILKTLCLHRLHQKDAAIENDLNLANYYVMAAQKEHHDNFQGLLNAVQLLQKAFTLYKNNGDVKMAENTQKRLVELQRKIPSVMTPITTKIDITDEIKAIKSNMEGLTFEESIVRMIQMVEFNKKAEIKERVAKEVENNIFTHIFRHSKVDDQGQIVATFPPLDINDIEKDPKLLELYMYQSEYRRQSITGDIILKMVLEIIRNKFSITNSMVDFLVNDNLIVPKGREKIFKSGICLFLKGDYYEALHILAPQTENLFRNIACEVGALTIMQKPDGSSIEKSLGQIFSLPEFLESYDNDIIFTFRGLLTEPAGANIRNEVAHGLISEYACSTGACLYFGVALIRLLAYTSKEYYRIRNESDKLKKLR